MTVALKKMPYMPLYCDDWLASRTVNLLPLDAQGLFIRCLLAQWEGGELPADPAEIALLVGNPPGFDAAWPKIAKLFQVHGNGIANRRGLERKEEWDALRRERAKAGVKGNEARWNGVANPSQNPSNPVATSSPPYPTPTPTPYPNPTPNPKTDPRATPAAPTALPFQSKEFQEAWTDFERHRKEKRSPLTPTAKKQALAKCAGWGEERAIAALKNSTANGYTGLFESFPAFDAKPQDLRKRLLGAPEFEVKDDPAAIEALQARGRAIDAKRAEFRTRYESLTVPEKKAIMGPLAAEFPDASREFLLDMAADRS